MSQSTQRLYSFAGMRGPAPMSTAVIPVDLFAHDQSGAEILLGCATAFCDSWENTRYLVTNWHNVTGRDPRTGQPKAPDGVIPSFLRAYFLQAIPTANGIGIQPITTVPIDIEISVGDSASWMMHDSGQAVDIAAIKLLNDPKIYIAAVNECIDVFDPVLQVGNELSILGFPRGLKPIGNFPIWKRASIATEPKWMADQERCFWIDSATREGMSGSPVIARALSVEDYSNQIGNGPLTDKTVIVSQPGIAFAGVYSGRVGVKDALEAQIGKVWHAQLVQEIFMNSRPLDFEII